MNILTPASLKRSSDKPTRTRYLSGFQSTPPRFQTSQAQLLNWLVNAHVRSGTIERTAIEALFAHCGASSEHISSRGHELADFTHERLDDMRLFGTHGSHLGEKTRFFDERVTEIFGKLYPTEAKSPRAIVHVTCTGYVSPSGAQRLVSSRDWGKQTEVLHAYHMGCYAAHPAVRMAHALPEFVDIVHTELCSLHLDPSLHDPAHLVIQSLFADGFIKYQVFSEAPAESAFEILAARDEIVPDSTGAMCWATGPLHFTMELSKEVPVLFASALPRFVQTLFEEAGLDVNQDKQKAVFAVHPGGPRIIELAERILGLESEQVRISRDVLRDHGNMSSATLPHIWQRIILDEKIEEGTVVVSLGAGPGLTLSGMLFVKR
jgi:predicted naringenin-chalcone synthase